MARIIDGSEMNLIGSKVKKLRLERNWSQQKVSDKLEMLAIYICRGSISRIENGRRAITDIEIDAISKVLGVSLDFLFGR